MNWQESLREVSKFYRWVSPTSKCLAEMETKFKMLHPGPFTMTWKDGHNKWTFQDIPVNLHFESEQEEIIWLLKNS
jgi:hypothetical protein